MTTSGRMDGATEAAVLIRPEPWYRYRLTTTCLDIVSDFHKLPNAAALQTKVDVRAQEVGHPELKSQCLWSLHWRSVGKCLEPLS